MRRPWAARGRTADFPVGVDAAKAVSRAKASKAVVTRQLENWRYWLRLLICAMLFVVAVPGLKADSADPITLNPAVTNLIRFPGDGAPTASWWSSFAADAIRMSTNSDGPELWQVTLPSETPLGLGVVRVDSNRRAGTYRLALVDPIPTSTNRMATTMTNAEVTPVVQLPVALEGILEGNAPHYLPIKLRAGESVSLEVVAQRLGYPLDSRLRILDAHGRELARADDSAIAGIDAILRFSAPAAGSFWVELSDVRQPPGSPRHYRLRLGDFPLSPIGWLPSMHPIPGPPELEPSHEFSGTSSPWTVPSSGFPVRLRGLGRPPGARDVVTFTANKGQRFRVDISDRRIGSAGDFTARIDNTAGRVLAEADLSKPELPSFTWTAPADDAYRLVIEEITGLGGPGYNYRLELKEGTGDFLLHLNDAVLEVKPGATTELKLKVQRRNYDGPLKLSVHGLPAEVGIEGQEVAAKTNDVALKLSIPTDFRPGTWMLFGVGGQAEIDGKSLEARADTRVALKKFWPELNDPPMALDGLVWLWVGAKPSTE